MDSSHYGKYPILRSDLRGVGLTKIHRPATREEESIELTRQAVAALHCLDHVRVDMRVGADGNLKIIEVNVRPSLWFSISEASGRPVVLEAYRDLAGLPPLPDNDQTHGVRWRYAIKDMISTLFYWRNRHFILPPPDIEVVGPKKRTTRAVFAADDWKPAAAEVWFLLQKAASRFTAQSDEPKRQ